MATTQASLGMAGRGLLHSHCAENLIWLQEGHLFQTCTRQDTFNRPIPFNSQAWQRLIASPSQCLAAGALPHYSLFQEGGWNQNDRFSHVMPGNPTSLLSYLSHLPISSYSELKSQCPVFVLFCVCVHACMCLFVYFILAMALVCILQMQNFLLRVLADGPGHRDICAA